MHYAFDLDGTLVDTKYALLEAYRAAGVEPPNDFFGKPFSEWYKRADADIVHYNKNKAYMSLLNLVNPLPLMELYKTLNYPPILTGASHSATTMILKHFQLCPEVVHTEMSVSKKIRLMLAYESGIMFEDNQEAAQRMRMETKWTICHTLTS